MERNVKTKTIYVVFVFIIDIILNYLLVFAIFEIFSAHFEQINFPLYEMSFFDDEQKKQLVSYFLKIILESSTKTSIGVPSIISNNSRISFGITTLPSSSTFLIIPVLFIFPFPPSFNLPCIGYTSICYTIKW